MEVLFFPNGNTAVLDNGKQVTELQQSWLVTFAKFLEDKGIDPTKVSFVVPSGQKVEVFKIPNNDYNWRIIDG
jgi:hypothetical protein